MSNTRYHFKTHVLLKSIIGKDLITNDNIAVLELVKNSFDANSKLVNIIFKNLKHNTDSLINKVNNSAEDYGELLKKTSKIIIQDFGKGMSGFDIRTKWLNIAYSEKKRKHEEFGRLIAGAKGIGRFSCDRLGRFLDIYTRKKDNDIYHLKIDWQDFEIEGDANLEIQNVDIEVKKIEQTSFEELTGYELFDSGTILEISMLRNLWTYYESNEKKKDPEWNKSKLLELRNYLEKMINPNQAFKQDSFSIWVHALDFIKDDQLSPANERINGEIKNRIFDKLDFTTTSIESEISHDGKTITTVLQDKGREIFNLVEINPFESRLKNIKLVLYFMNRYAKIYFATQSGIRTKDFGSIFLFINGFRITPYGDEGNDWLGLETRKVQSYARNLGTRELVGRVEVLDNEDHFRQISNREGVEKNEYFNILTKEFFFKILRRLEKFVVDGLDWDKVTVKYTYDDDEDVDIGVNIRNFTKKVESENWVFSPDDEVYSESQDAKDKRIVKALFSIINTNPSNIISLKINASIIETLVEEEREKFEKVFEDFQKFDSEILDTSTQNAIHKVKKILDKKENERRVAQLNFEEERKRRLNAEKESSRNKVQLEIEKKKNLFLQATSKELTKEALGLIHHIKYETVEINSNVILLLSEINEQKLDKKSISSKLSSIKLSSDKILKISDLVTHSNFNEIASTDLMDLVGYIVEYIEEYENIFKERILDIKVNGKDLTYITRFSVLELSIILDNLISNSKKASSKFAQIDLEIKNSNLIMLFSDDGIGVKKSVSDHIFELGITTTDGSGIGLYTCLDLMNKIGGNIRYLGNGIVLKGATFELVFGENG